MSSVGTRNISIPAQVDKLLRSTNAWKEMYICKYRCLSTMYFITCHHRDPILMPSLAGMCAEFIAYLLTYMTLGQNPVPSLTIVVGYYPLIIDG